MVETVIFLSSSGPWILHSLELFYSLSIYTLFSFLFEYSKAK